MSPYLRSPEGDPAEPHYEPAISVVVDGNQLEALPGQTVAAVLMSAGRDSWRTTRTTGRPRGTFCGIGACHDCLVVVNGTPDVRACQTTVVSGDEITTQKGALLPARAAGADDPAAVGGEGAADAGRAEVGGGARVVVDVVVVGGGPAGMAAAVEAAVGGGVRVVVVDAGRRLGGQFWRQLPVEFGARRAGRLQHGWGGLQQQLERLEGHPGVEVLSGCSVWAFEEGEEKRKRLWLQGGGVQSVEARAVVLATGAFDRVLPFPGWELPGVYSAGAAQALAKGQRISVGRRVLVAGTGPFLLPVAASLIGVGAEVVALLEANHLSTSVRGWLSDPAVLPGKAREAIQYAGTLVRHRIPFLQGRTVIAAHGRDRVEAVTTARLDKEWRKIPGTERDLEVDAVCLGFGFTPQLELATTAGCELGEGPDGGPAVVVDEYQQTSQPGIFAAGELTGIGGADLAAEEGRAAGASAAAFIQGRPPHEGQVAKGKRFAKALAKAYPIQPGWKTWSDGETIVCRCEEVTRGQLETAMADRDITGERSLKLTSRAGLGLCQGRVCSRNTADLTGVPADHRRPIAVPIKLKDLASLEDL